MQITNWLHAACTRWACPLRAFTNACCLGLLELLGYTSWFSQLDSSLYIHAYMQTWHSCISLQIDMSVGWQFLWASHFDSDVSINNIRTLKMPSVDLSWVAVCVKSWAWNLRARQGSCVFGRCTRSSRTPHLKKRTQKLWTSNITPRCHAEGTAYTACVPLAVLKTKAAYIRFDSRVQSKVQNATAFVELVHFLWCNGTCKHWQHGVQRGGHYGICILMPTMTIQVSFCDIQCKFDQVIVSLATHGFTGACPWSFKTSICILCIL